MASIIKVDEIKSQANGSALSIASGGAVTNNSTFTSTGAITASGGIANAFLNNTSDLSDHKLLKNENAFINNEYVSLAALPVKTSSKLSIKVPSIDENGKKLRSEFN